MVFEMKCIDCGRALKKDFGLSTGNKRYMNTQAHIRCFSCYKKKRNSYRRNSYNRAKTNPTMKMIYNSEKRRLRAQYGITNYQVVLDRIKQNKCDLCGREVVSRHLKHIDHCHDTGKIRGVLCCNCNTLIGRVEKVGLHVIPKIKDYLENSEIIGAKTNFIHCKRKTKETGASK